MTITKRGRPVARLVPITPESEARFPQLDLIGSVWVLGDIVSPPVNDDAMGFDEENL